MRIALALLLAAAPSAAATMPQLEMPSLADSLRTLKAEEQRIVDETVQLIQKKEHTLAFLALSRLVKSNPKNSSLRVLRSYAALQLANLAGALEDARIAEGSGAPSAYRCWFLAQVAFLAGNAKMCRREVAHLEADSTYGSQAVKLRQNLETGKR